MSLRMRVVLDLIVIRGWSAEQPRSSPEMTALRPATALRRLPLHLLPSEWQSSGLARTSSPSTMKEGRQKGKRPFWHAQRDAELRTPHCASLSQRPTRLALCSCWACRVKTNLAPFSHHHGNLEHAHKSHKCKKKKKKKQWRAQSSELGRERRRKTEKDKGSVMKEERCCWLIGCERHLFCGSLVCFWSCSSGLDEGPTLPGISR